jgi:beta-lactamase regulating signal transducer with metallopeptidase domain
MFVTLLLTTFAIATAVSVLVAVAFRNPVRNILNRTIADQISSAWLRYLVFAMFVVGISSGVRIWDLEKYVTKPPVKGGEIVQLTQDRWILEIYRTVIDTLQGLAWVLLVFFAVALFAFVMVRLAELRRDKQPAIESETEEQPIPDTSRAITHPRSPLDSGVRNGI